MGQIRTRPSPSHHQLEKCVDLRFVLVLSFYKRSDDPLRFCLSCLQTCNNNLQYFSHKKDSPFDGPHSLRYEDQIQECLTWKKDNQWELLHYSDHMFYLYFELSSTNRPKRF